MALLTDADVERHRALGIPLDLLKRQQVRRVDDREARDLLGGQHHGDLAGIVYPRLDPRTGDPRGYRVRRDHPEMERGRPKAKYLSSIDRAHLYFLVGADAQFSSIALPVLFVESEKAAMAIAAAAARMGRDILPVGLGGCWGWKGRIGKTVDAAGARVDEHGPLPDLDLITWADRDVMLLFDGNARTNRSVAAARQAFAEELTRRGAKVRVVDLPTEPGINGPDDYLGRHGDAALFALIDTADRQGVSLDDFHAYMPQHTYIFAPTRESWPASSVNARLQPIPVVDAQGQPVVDADGTPKVWTPNNWLDRHRPVEQLTWAPGEPLVVRGRLVSDGGWIVRPGCATFNLYRAPTLIPGTAALAGPWIDHLRKLYPNEADHILNWLAHRVQRPHEKINHALVLGGLQGVGKDTLLEPVKAAIGPWNFVEVAPSHLLGRFNGFVKSVILRVSEARDLGDVDRYGFYEHSKTLTAAPPDVFRCDEKNIREHAVFNVTGVVFTTNHKANGLYLPADDRRHFVAWSDLTKDAFADGYFKALYHWYQEEGNRHVAACLRDYDLSTFDPKAPPPKTAAFWDIVDASRAPEDAELADVLDVLMAPAVTLEMVATQASGDFATWLRDRKNARQVPHRMEAAGYVSVRNTSVKDGMWVVQGRRQVIYARRDLSLCDRLIEAKSLAGR